MSVWTYFSLSLHAQVDNESHVYCLRMYQLHPLQKGKTLPFQKGCSGDDIKLHPVVRLHLCRPLTSIYCTLV